MLGLNPTVIIGVVLAFIVSNVISFGVGHHNGYAAEHDKFLAFQSEVRAAGEAAEAKNKAIIAGHQTVTAQVTQDYESKMAALQANADAAHKAQQAAHAADIQSLQDIHAAKVDELQAVHISTTQQITEGISNAYQSKIDAIHALYADRLRKPSANSGSGNVPIVSSAASGNYDRSAYDVLAADCAITTQKYVSLREWVNRQGAVQ